MYQLGLWTVAKGYWQVVYPVRWEPFMFQCKYIIVSRKRSPSQPAINLNINGTILNKVEHIKYLGVWISENLSWSKHITKMPGRTYIQTVLPTFIHSHTEAVVHQSPDLSSLVKGQVPRLHKTKRFLQEKLDLGQGIWLFCTHWCKLFVNQGVWLPMFP